MAHDKPRSKRELKVRSSVFERNASIPKRYTGDGENLSPPLEWMGAPEETRELAVIVDDPDAPGSEPFAHWVICHIPPATTSLSGGASRGGLPRGTTEGRNSFKGEGYGGPAPPPGKAHHYHFHVYALDTPIVAKGDVDRGTLLREMKGHILAEGDLVGTYERR
jgi:Raf kinase inhibitor-like YbhB/YbcL family protein